MASPMPLKRSRMRTMPEESGFGAKIELEPGDAFTSEAVQSRLRSALTRHRVLAFPALGTEPETLIQFASALGPLVRHDFVAGIAEHDHVHEIRKEPWHAHNFGGTWHSDGAYLARPPKFIVLQAVTIPEAGGDTLWACQIAAYKTLQRARAQDLAQAQVSHTAATVYAGYPDAGQANVPRSVCHPLFRWLPDHEEIAIFHSGPCVDAIIGLSALESERHLANLFKVATETLVFRHRWRRGDLVVWDNRATLHMAMNDYPGQSRLMRRAVVDAERPRPVPLRDGNGREIRRSS